MKHQPYQISIICSRLSWLGVRVFILLVNLVTRFVSLFIVIALLVISGELNCWLVYYNREPAGSKFSMSPVIKLWWMPRCAFKIFRLFDISLPVWPMEVIALQFVQYDNVKLRILYGCILEKRFSNNCFIWIGVSVLITNSSSAGVNPYFLGAIKS